ncbi:MAG TPA: hypothetical protein VMR43_08305 [Variovorax sp.]|nr:hypothetical protein [Variovorax sp.]
MSDDLNALAQRIGALEEAVRRLSDGGGSGGGAGAPQSASVTPAEWRNLGDKLDRLESSLNDKEKAVLLTILGAAAASMGQGSQEAPALAASRVNLTGAIDKVKLSDGLLSIGQFSKGAIGSGGAGPVSDSVNVGGDFTSVHGDWSKDLKDSLPGTDLATRGRWNAIGAAGGANPVVTPGGFGVSGIGGGGGGGGGGFR